MSPDDKRPLNPVPDPEPEADKEKSPAEIRAQIVTTRAELGDTIEALAGKTDVKAQAKAKVEDVKGQAKAKIEDVKAKAEEAAPESPQEGAQQAQALVRENPKPVAIAAALVFLFILWRLMRS